VWAPAAERVEVLLLGRQAPVAHAMARDASGIFSTCVPEAGAGALYRYRLDGHEALPDPASRFQPEGVHGPSMVVDPSSFVWTDAEWRGLDARALVIYELHVGAFTREGTFAGVEACLDALVDLGVTAVELMPIADFAGRRNWGYDGVDLFAPSHQYGTPDDLRRLVDAAHRRGLGVILDVVYNHFGPSGAYIFRLSPHVTTDRYETPWGAGVNLDGAHSGVVRRFFIENALHWVHEYHVDGLRLDATHALRDGSRTHFLAELTSTVHASTRGRSVLVFAEDERNEATLVRDRDRGGYGLDGVWADDFHHQVRRAVAGDHEGYFESFTGRVDDITRTLRSGWFFTGQFCGRLGKPRGTDPSGVPLHRFVTCLQNHDQVGNRPFGDRLHHRIDPAVYRAVSALLLLAPETPLIFMGQEWAASTPFQFFTDHDSELGPAITEGRRTEFAAFSAFADPESRSRIPDPQDASTFEASRLNWNERGEPAHARVLRLYRALLHLRRSIVCDDRAHADIRALDDDTLSLAWSIDGDQPSLLVVVRLRNAGRVQFEAALDDPHGSWRVVLTTEDDPFVERGRPPVLDAGSGPAVEFSGASAIVLRR
jgi:maltooligosyltrehalose trehalohydrolase